MLWRVNGILHIKCSTQCLCDVRILKGVSYSVVLFSMCHHPDLGWHLPMLSSNLSEPSQKPQIHTSPI